MPTSSNVEEVKSGWIDCRKRLPDHGDFVLVWHKGYPQIACRSPGEASDWYSIANTWLKKDDVDCWRELPEAP